jgi:hypothetical protein
MQASDLKTSVPLAPAGGQRGACSVSDRFQCRSGNGEIGLSASGLPAQQPGPCLNSRGLQSSVRQTVENGSTDTKLSIGAEFNFLGRIEPTEGIEQPQYSSAVETRKYEGEEITDPWRR